MYGALVDRPLVGRFGVFQLGDVECPLCGGFTERCQGCDHMPLLLLQVCCGHWKACPTG